ncbi:MAG: glycosyltransferase family 39 protein [Acidobacteriia bacterium]|nr:glycosyltransferase family 39 protein [Terriglobia bacterium]
MPESRAHSIQSPRPVQVKNILETRQGRRVAGAVLGAGFFLLVLFFRNPFFGQWDSFDYMTKALRHEVSDLAFGRPVFLGIQMAAWESAKRLGLSVTHADWAGQSVVMLFALLALVSFYFCAKQLVDSRTAMWGTVALATTPMVVAYSGMIMTEVPSLTCLIASVGFLLRWQKTRKHWDLVGSALIFAAGVHMREQLITTAVVFPLVIVLDRRLSGNQRARAIVVHTAVYWAAIVIVMGWLWWTDAQYLDRIRFWAGAMGLRKGTLGMQLLALFKFTLASSLVALIALMTTVRWWSKHLTCRALAAGMVVLPLLALLADYDLPIQPRYAVVAVPGMILVALAGLKAAWPMMSSTRRRRVAALLWIGQGLFLIGGLGVLLHFNHISAERKARLETLKMQAPAHSLFIGGAYTPALVFYRQSGIRPDWQIIYSGWTWDAEQLPVQVAAALHAHQSVYVLHDAQAWDYLQSEWQDVRRLRRNFQFKEVDGGLEQITAK